MILINRLHNINKLETYMLKFIVDKVQDLKAKYNSIS